MVPELWVSNIVFGTIRKVRDGFINDAKYRCLMFLLQIGVFRDDPTCTTCGKSPVLQERLDKGSRSYQWVYPKANARGCCPECSGKHPSVARGTNFFHLRDWPAFLHLHTLLNADYPHQVAKDVIAAGYNVTRPETLEQWVVWILELAHVYVWNHTPTVLGGTDLKQVSIDESFWQRGRISKHMAPGEATEQVWI